MKLADIESRRGVFETLVCRQYVWHRGAVVQVREPPTGIPGLSIRSDLAQGSTMFDVVSDLLDAAKLFMAAGRTCMFKVGEFSPSDGTNGGRRVVVEIVAAKEFGGEPRRKSGPRMVKKRLLVESKAANAG